MKRFLMVMAVFAAVGCGGGKNPDRAPDANHNPAHKLGDHGFDILPANDMSLKFENTQLSGRGSVRMTDLLPQARVPANYTVTFELPPGGSLSLITNAKRNLTAGVVVRFSRSGDGRFLLAEAITGAASKNLNLADVGAEGVITLSIDVHNDHFQPEIIIWNDTDGEKSEEPAIEVSLPGTGQGANWGFDLNNAKILHVQRQGPRETH